MNNEETIIDPQNESKNNVENTAKRPNAKGNSSWAEKAAYAMGGAVVGAGVTAAGHAMASTAAAKPDEEHVEGQVAATAVNDSSHVEVNDSTAHAQIATPQAEQQNAPEPEDAIVATATGIRVAQVDDSESFAQAFADARAQVGAGGVFEWHGRAYSTYYKDEWDSMSSEERAEFQASIDYKDVISDESIAQHYNDIAQNNLHQNNDSDSQPDTEHQVHVLEVGKVDVDGDGINETGAVLDVDGNEVVVLDINNDGIADVAVLDANGNGIIETGEAVDISAGGMQMPTSAESAPTIAQTDDAPDYMNDADVGLYEA